MQCLIKNLFITLLQLTDYFNVEKDYLLEDTGPGYDAYDMYIDNLRFYGKNASHLDATFCTRFVNTTSFFRTPLENVLIFYLK